MKTNSVTSVVVSDKHLFADFIDQQTKQNPKTTAIRFNQQYLTYQALNNSTNQLAHYLQDKGVQKGTMVAISVERSLEMVVGILGIMKAGGIYVPIDPSYPDERIQYILEDTSTKILLTQQHLITKFGEVEQVISFETDWLNILNYPTEAPFVELQNHDLAYIIYTSGSTGKPKGVMVTHENLWYSTTARLQYYPDKVRSFLLLSSFAFDSSVAGIFWTLADGGTLVLPPQNTEKDPLCLVNLIEEHHISHLLCLPSLHNLLLDYPTSKLVSLQTVIVAGEACPKSLVNKHYQVLPSINLYNEYGPTEGSVWSTVYYCPKQMIEAQSVPIGKGIAHAKIYILDENQQPVKLGEQGEIYIGGKGVAKGYLHQTKLTDEKFLELQISNEKPAKVYRTGDLGSWLSDGNIEFLGRTDHQIKLRGYRIELGEIEEVICQQAGVQEAVVVVKGNAANSRKLVAYATLQPGYPLKEVEIKANLKQHLPEYMIPTNIVFLKEIPRTPNGKINRKSLSELQLPFENTNRTLKSNHLLQRQNDALENFMLQLWCEILEVESVGLKDKFFELGGNSLQAAQFINQVQKELQESIFIVTIFDNPTIAEYAAMLRRDYKEALDRHPVFNHIGTLNTETPLSTQTPKDTNTYRHFSKTSLPTLKEADFNNFHQYIPTTAILQNRNFEETTATKPIIFILAPPRSGTTLLRVMLAGHPQLFAANELQLLGFDTMRERNTAYSGKFGLWKEGLIRTVMELQGCDADHAKFSIFQCEQQGRKTFEMYRLLQHWLGDKILVDKSPSYSMDSNILQQAAQQFGEKAIFIHLVRHPYAMIQSFAKMRMNQVAYLLPHSYNAREIGELTWTHSHQNIYRFLKNIPANRQYRLHFEQLAQNPEQHLQAMCEQIGLQFHKNMANPYQNIESKMVDGIYSDSKAMGDPKLLQQKSINPKLADSWRGVLKNDFLSATTWEVYRQFEDFL
ncbi:MAG: amino acid adenylation domain-containing protein [Chitinophagales bacterium]